nr:hypothetical protein [Tanacetum cinerariifolium]
MEEYIRLEEEKARKHGKVFNWETAKYDSKNDNEKVMPSLPSPEPTVSCFDDLDFFKDFENEFPAIVYNDAQMSKSYLLTELILSPQHINKFDLNCETSLSEYDEDEQNVLYFNDLFPFNIIHLDDLKFEKDNDDNEIDIIQSLGNYYGMLFYLIMNLYVSFGIPFDPKRYYKDGVYTMMLWRPRSRSIAATWLEKVVTPLIEPAVKGFAAASPVLKSERLKVDKHGMSESMSYYLID